MMEVHTMTECAAPNCKRGVRPRYAIHGLCAECARAEIERLRGIERVLKGITDLPLARPWHVLASIVREAGYRRWTEIIDAIADALEADA